MSNTANGFKSLIVWQKSIDFTLAVYKATQGFPKEEQYGLISQLRRAASSVPANIAEGYGRSHVKDADRFYDFANGSLDEVETFLIIAFRLSYLDEKILKEISDLKEEVARLLYGFRKSKKPLTTNH